jgi:hypothetical protein
MTSSSIALDDLGAGDSVERTVAIWSTGHTEITAADMETPLALAEAASRHQRRKPDLALCVGAHCPRYQPQIHPPDMGGAGLEWATACVFAIAKPSAAKNMLMESAAAAISRRRSMAAVNIGSSFCACPFWAWRHKAPESDATLCVNAHGKSFHTVRDDAGGKWALIELLSARGTGGSIFAN